MNPTVAVAAAAPRRLLSAAVRSLARSNARSISVEARAQDAAAAAAFTDIPIRQKMPKSAGGGCCGGSGQNQHQQHAPAAADAQSLASSSSLSSSSSVSSSSGKKYIDSPSPAAVFGEGAEIRNNWTRSEIQAIYDSPIMDLLYWGAHVHRKHQNFREVQQCTLLSIKTGGCQEDCKYCPQSSKYDTGLKAEKLMKEDDVIAAARAAKDAGSSRFCMGAAWRDMNGRKTNFESILGYVKEIRSMGMEVCCTLGMINDEQATRLKDAGLTAYNHNLDTSREFYPQIITTRTYDERLQTLAAARNAGLSVCSGGIIGLGEAEEDRVGLLHTLSTLPEHPESVPVNALVAVKGTPLENQEPVSIWEMIRMIATARIIMPRSTVRLSAGRIRFSMVEQSLCFMAGANSIFAGDKLLTTKNNEWTQDQQMFEVLGLIPKPANFNQGSKPKRCEEVSVPEETPQPERAAAL